MDKKDYYTTGKTEEVCMAEICIVLTSLCVCVCVHVDYRKGQLSHYYKQLKSL